MRAKALSDGVAEVFAENQFAAGGGGDGVAREVVFGGSEAAGEDHEFDAVERFADGGGEEVAVVAHDQFAADFDAESVELVRDEEGVRVDALRGEEFRAYRDDFGFHVLS